MPAELMYPEATRHSRQLIGGALYFILGVIFLIVAFVGEEKGPDEFWLFAAALGVIVGITVSGYRHHVRIDRGSGLIRSYTGFFFIGRYRRCGAGDFRAVEVRRRTRVGMRFSNLPKRDYEPTLDVTYEVVLQGRKPLEIETTGERELADKWAKEVGTALKLPVTFVDDDKIETPEKARGRRIDKWVALGGLLAGLAAFAWILYNLMQIG